MLRLACLRHPANSPLRLFMRRYPPPGQVRRQAPVKSRVDGVVFVAYSPFRSSAVMNRARASNRMMILKRKTWGGQREEKAAGDAGQQGEIEHASKQHTLAPVAPLGASESPRQVPRMIQLDPTKKAKTHAAMSPVTVMSRPIPTATPGTQPEMRHCLDIT
jgi:hypothetical protein